jgi:hypothetical protein
VSLVSMFLRQAVLIYAAKFWNPVLFRCVLPSQHCSHITCIVRLTVRGNDPYLYCRIDYVVHGDDPCIVDGKDVYESAVKMGTYYYCCVGVLCV